MVNPGSSQVLLEQRGCGSFSHGAGLLHFCQSVLLPSAFLSQTYYCEHTRVCLHLTKSLSKKLI